MNMTDKKVYDPEQPGYDPEQRLADGLGVTKEELSDGLFTGRYSKDRLERAINSLR